MLMNCLKCRKNTENKSQRIAKTNKERIILLLKCGVCDNKKTISTKKWQAGRLLNSLGLKTSYSKIPLFSNILFYRESKP